MGRRLADAEGFADANLTPVNSPLGEKIDLAFKDYYELRLRLTYGSNGSKEVNGKIKPFNKEVMKMVNNLGIANAGLLEANELKV